MPLREPATDTCALGSVLSQHYPPLTRNMSLGNNHKSGQPHGFLEELQPSPSSNANNSSSQTSPLILRTENSPPNSNTTYVSNFQNGVDTDSRRRSSSLSSVEHCESTCCDRQCKSMGRNQISPVLGYNSSPALDKSARGSLRHQKIFHRRLAQPISPLAKEHCEPSASSPVERLSDCPSLAIAPDREITAQNQLRLHHHDTGFSQCLTLREEAKTHHTEDNCARSLSYSTNASPLAHQIQDNKYTTISSPPKTFEAHDPALSAFRSVKKADDWGTESSNGAVANPLHSAFSQAALSVCTTNTSQNITAAQKQNSSCKENVESKTQTGNCLTSSNIFSKAVYEIECPNAHEGSCLTSEESQKSELNRIRPSIHETICNSKESKTECPFKKVCSEAAISPSSAIDSVNTENHQNCVHLYSTAAGQITPIESSSAGHCPDYSSLTFATQHTTSPSKHPSAPAKKSPQGNFLCSDAHGYASCFEEKVFTKRSEELNSTEESLTLLTTSVAPVTVQQFHLKADSPCVHRQRNVQCLERDHVYQVYREIAPQCDHVRHRAWPRVTRFLKDLEPGSLVADIGCGSGRYLNVNSHIVKFGSDICVPFLDQARSQGYEVAAANNFALPFRDASFDAVISIGVIHHFASLERRVKALDELARILSPGGKLMVYVWAFEQTHRKFDSQDVLIPWARPEGKGLSRRNTVCCLAGEEPYEQSSPSVNRNRRMAGDTDLEHVEPKTNERHGASSERQSRSHTLRRRSRSVGDDPESSKAIDRHLLSTTDQEHSSRSQRKTRQFGVFDRRSGNSSAAQDTSSFQGESHSREASVPKDDISYLNLSENVPPLTKLPSQLVSECRKLGRFLRSLSSKSWSSTEGVEPTDCCAADGDPSGGFSGLPKDSFDLCCQNDSLGCDNKTTRNLEESVFESDVAAGNADNDFEECTTENHDNGALKDHTAKTCESPNNYHQIVTDVDKTELDLADSKEHVKKQIVLANIKTVCHEIEKMDMTNEATGLVFKTCGPEDSKELIENQETISFKIPFNAPKCTQDNNHCGSTEVSMHARKVLSMDKQSVRLSLENINDFQNGAVSDGYATDAECSPYGIRTPLGETGKSGTALCECSVYSPKDNLQSACSIATSYDSLSHHQELNSKTTFTEGRETSLNFSFACTVPIVCTTTGSASFDPCDATINCSSEGPDDDGSPDANEAKSQYMAKSYLQVVTPVLISSSADESDGMSPGNLSPCSWYTGGGQTSGDSEGPDVLPINHTRNVIALDKVCFAHGQVDGQMQLQKWVHSQRSQRFDSSNEDIAADLPQRSSRSFRGNSASSKRSPVYANHSEETGILPHIQVQTLRDGDIKTYYKSDPNLPEAPRSPLFLASVDPDNSRSRAYSDVSVMDNQRVYRYSDSVFSDTLRTPSIATPGLRTPSSGGGLSDYNTSTEVLFAPSDLADNNECFFDTDSVFTPDAEREHCNKTINAFEAHLDDTNKSSCSDPKFVKVTNDLATSDVDMRRRPSRMFSLPDKENQRLPSSDSESLPSLEPTTQAADSPSDVEKSLLGRDRDCHHDPELHPIKVVFSKIAGMLGHFRNENSYDLISDTESNQSRQSAKILLDIKMSTNKRNNPISSGEEEDIDENRSSGDTTTATSLTLSCTSPQDSSPDLDQSPRNPVKTGYILNVNGDPKEDKDRFKKNNYISKDKPINSQGIKDEAAKNIQIRNISPGEGEETFFDGNDGLKDTTFFIHGDRQGKEHSNKFKKSFLQALTQKLSLLFRSDESNKQRQIMSFDPDDSSEDEGEGLLPKAKLEYDVSCNNVTMSGKQNISFTSAQRPQTLDFSRKRSRLISHRRASSEKTKRGWGISKQVGRESRKAQNAQSERQLSVIAAIDLLSEGVSEDSLLSELDAPAKAVFAEMRRLNFAVREFPRSSLDLSTTQSQEKEKNLPSDTREASSSVSTVQELAEVTIPYNTTDQNAVAGDPREQSGKPQSARNTCRRQPKTYGTRRRFSDSLAAAQRGRKDRGMIHLKPPNWALGYDSRQEDYKSQEKTHSNGTSAFDSVVERRPNYSNSTDVKKFSESKGSPRVCNRSLSLSDGQGHSDMEKPVNGKSARVDSDLSTIETFACNVSAYLTNSTVDSQLRACKDTFFKSANSASSQSYQTDTNTIPPYSKPESFHQAIVSEVDAKSESSKDYANKSLHMEHICLKDRKNNFHIPYSLEQAESNFPRTLSPKHTQIRNEGIESCSNDSNASGNVPDNKSDIEDKIFEDISLSRYYHVFRHGELDGLVTKFVPSLGIIDTFYDHSNWCIVAQKK